jgi:hypothetical protein
MTAVKAIASAGFGQVKNGMIKKTWLGGSTDFTFPTNSPSDEPTSGDTAIFGFGTAKKSVYISRLLIPTRLFNDGDNGV